MHLLHCNIVFLIIMPIHVVILEKKYPNSYKISMNSLFSVNVDVLSSRSRLKSPDYQRSLQFRFHLEPSPHCLSSLSCNILKIQLHVFHDLSSGVELQGLYFVYVMSMYI